MVHNIALLAEPLVEVIVAVVAVARPLDPAPDLRPVGEPSATSAVFLPEFRLIRSVSFSARRLREIERASTKRMESMILDLAGPVWSGDDGKPLEEREFLSFLKKT